MWKNYFKISLRNLSKRKLYTGINILGLTIAVASFITIGLYIHHEATYDSMYTDSDRIVRFGQKFVMAGEEQVVSMTPSSLVPTIMEEIEEVEVGTLVFDLSIFSSVLVDAGEGNQEENKFAYVDENFFEVFDLELLTGQEGRLLAEPSQIVLTKSTAEKYYKNINTAVGQLIKIDGKDYEVTGVVADFPSNSHLDFDFLASFKTHRHGTNPAWSPANYYSYAKLIPNADKELFASKLGNMVEKYFGEEMRSYGFEVSIFFQPLQSIYLGDSQLKEMKPVSDIKNLYIFGIVAVLLIIIGIINYVNLATAEATERNKEVGLRKVMGAGRIQLFGQFISESFILSFLSLVLSIVLLLIFRSQFEAFAGVPLNTELLFHPIGITTGLFLLIFIAFFAGLYPSLILSRLEPLQALGKQLVGMKGGPWLRRSLVVFQFFVSISLLVATLIVKQQLEHLQSVNLGYDREAIVALNFHYNMRESIPSFKNELERGGVALSSSLGNAMPHFIQAGYSVMPGGDNDKEFMITGFAVDHDMVKTIGLNLIAGSDFSDQDIDQTTSYEENQEMYVIFNEAAIKELGWSPEESIGRRISYNGANSIIKGVVENFYFNSLHHQVGPLAIFIQPSEANWLLVKMPKGNPSEYLTKLEETWKGIFPDRPFAYRFLDEEYGKMYMAEQKIGQIFSLFAVIAICIACMGLFGLVSYVALRRTREISIRKVLGAKASDVLKVLSADFFALLGISSVLSVLFGIWFSKEWLQGFANKTVISPWIFVWATGTVALISLLTIGFRTMKVFVQNPAKTLKDQ
jgi:putative ABC transport system permease protein